MSEITRERLVADAERVRLEDGTLIATVWQQYPSKDQLPGESWLAMMKRTDQARADAKQQAIDRTLSFSAAPELLEALKLFVWPHQEGCRLTESERQEIGRAAIAKALGA